MIYESQEVANPQQLKHDDIVMILMGATGTGKSHIIDTLTGQNGRLSGNSLECVTKYVTGHRIQNHPKYGSSLVCVDTPGFDDTHLLDMDILAMISEWLKYMDRHNIPLAGIFHLHRVTDNRMGGTPLRSLRIFNELCGDAARSAVLITTMWDKLSSHTEGERREESLKKHYWHGMIQHGAFVDRFENTFKSAWDVVGTMVVRSRKNDGGIPLLIQEELMIHKKRLEETKAARAIYWCLQDHLSKRQEAVQLLTDVSKYQSDESINLQLFDLQRDIENILREVDRLHISFGRKLFHFILDKSQMRPSRIPRTSATLPPNGGIASGISNVNPNPRQASGYTVHPREGENPRLPAGTRESWIYLEGVDVFSTSENGPATEQAKNPNSIPIQREVEPEKKAPAEYVNETKTLLEKLESQPQIDFAAAPGLTERKAEERPKLRQSEIEQSRSDAEEVWVEDEPQRTRRVPSRKRKTRSLNRKKAKSTSPTRNLINQLEEIVSRLPKIEGIEHFTFCPDTHVRGGDQAGAALTAAVPQVGNVTFVNSNNTCTCAQYVAETDGGGNPPLPTGTRECIYLEGVDVFSASENGAATEQANNPNPIPIQREVEPEKKTPAEHVSQTKNLLEKMEPQPQIDFAAAPGLTERKAEERPKLRQSEIEQSRSDVEEAWVKDEPQRTRRVPSRKRKAKSLNRKKAKSMSPTRNPISQLEEILSRLPKIEGIEGDVHLHFTLCPDTHVHGGDQAGAAPAAAVPNVKIVNSNNTCTCAQYVAETDGGGNPCLHSGPRECIYLEGVDVFSASV